MEIWKPIKGYEGLYEVSNTGKIRSLDRYTPPRTNQIKGRYISQRYSHNGYKRVRLCKNTVKKDYNVHVLVCENFISDRPTPKHEVNHKDHNKENNNSYNLEWVTKSDNIQYSYDSYMSEKARIVLDTSNGVFYPSIREAAYYNNMHHRKLHSILIGRVKNKTSLIFA